MRNVRLTPRPVRNIPTERTPVPTEQKVGWTPETAWTFWRREKPLAPIGIRAPDHPAHGLVCIAGNLAEVSLGLPQSNIMIACSKDRNQLRSAS
jgi:hypothetical protein